MTSATTHGGLADTIAPKRHPEKPEEWHLVPRPTRDMVRYYCWEVPVRLTHWLIALSIAVLSVTGLYIGHPFLVVQGEARHHFVMGWMKAFHSYAAIVFTLAVLSRIAWMFLGNRYARWDQFIPVSRDRWKKLWGTFLFYVFLRRRAPLAEGHNPLAGLAYTGIFVLCLVEIATGLALYSISAHVDSPMGVFAFLLPLVGGAQTARLVHHVIMWLLIGFTVHHVYSAILMSAAERNATMDSIFTGYRCYPPDRLRGADWQGETLEEETEQEKRAETAGGDGDERSAGS